MHGPVTQVTQRSPQWSPLGWAAVLMPERCLCFLATQPLDAVISLWPQAAAELQLNCCFSALRIVDLCRPWASRIIATDASPSFGFGACHAKLDPRLVRDAASVAGRGPHHFHLKNRVGSESDKPRAGTRHVLPLRWSETGVIVGKSMLVSLKLRAFLAGSEKYQQVSRVKAAASHGCWRCVVCPAEGSIVGSNPAVLHQTLLCFVAGCKY